MLTERLRDTWIWMLVDPRRFLALKFLR